MPPRKDFPNPEQIKALTPKSEGMAEDVRSVMPFATTEVPSIPTPGHEKREANEEEIFLMGAVEHFMSAFFGHHGFRETPIINNRYVRITQKIKNESLAAFEHPQSHLGSTGLYSDIVLDAFHPDRPDGVRTFLHVAAHEFAHAKSKNQWTIGERTLRRITGFNNIIAHISTPEDPRLNRFPTKKFFNGLNEAMTEMIAILVFQDIADSQWFRETQRENEEATRELRTRATASGAIADAEIIGFSQNSNGEIQTIFAYQSELIVLDLLVRNIEEVTQTPPQEILHLFIADYAEGTMKRVTPLLRRTFGNNILRVLSVWEPNEPNNAQDIQRYLLEKDSHRRDILARQYLESHGTVPQSSS